MNRLRYALRAIFLTRYDRWDWIVACALLIALIATNGDRVLIALVGVVSGQQLMRAARAWRRQ